MRHTRPRIGVSACFFHADPKRNLFKGKTLLYAEESFLHWIMSEGAMPVLLPRAGGLLNASDLVEDVDGLLLAGGSDMSPRNYGEEPLRVEWAGDHARDLYEMDLIRLCMAADKPVLGVCRGAQVLNVALGGSLYQDIEMLHEGHRVHRDWETYDRYSHDVTFAPGAHLAGWYGGAGGRVNSVHHQGLKDLGRDLVVEARSVPDGVIEAVRYAPKPGTHGGRAPFAYGVQWHPEFMAVHPGEDFLDARVLLRAYLGEVNSRRPGGAPARPTTARKDA
jgi:putative glutamine amidotransferase